MPDLINDTAFWPVVAQLAACMCEQLEDAGGPELCFCGVVTGNTATADLMNLSDDCGGQAWVRVGRIYGATQFPDVDEITRCSSALAVEIEMGVVRPNVWAPLEANEAPGVGDLAAEAALQLSDMAALRRAIACCFTQTPGFSDSLYNIGTWLPLGPEGNIVGGAWTLQIQQAF